MDSVQYLLKVKDIASNFQILDKSLQRIYSCFVPNMKGFFKRSLRSVWPIDKNLEVDYSRSKRLMSKQLQKQKGYYQPKHMTIWF